MTIEATLMNPKTEERVNFDFPLEFSLDFDDMEESIEKYKDYKTIEVTTDILGEESNPEYYSFETLNNYAEILDGLTSMETEFIEAIANDCGFDLGDCISYIEDGKLEQVVLYSGCHTMGDVAREISSEYVDDFNSAISFLLNYVDYDALGRDLEIDGNFVETYYGIIQYEY